MNKISLILLVWLIWFTGNASAHRVNVYAYAEGKTIYVQAYFHRGSPARDALVEVFAPDGKKLISLHTDQQGEAKFPAPFRTDLTIKVNAGEGHSNDFTIKADELPNNLLPYQVENLSSPTLETSPTELPATLETPSLSQISMGQKELQKLMEQVVEEAVEKKIAPLRKMIMDIHQAERDIMPKILGGIGFIVGISGLYMYIKVKLERR